MLRRLLLIPILIALLAAPAAACVGKTLVVGTDGSAPSRFVAQILAILINERTGTTVQIQEHESPDALFAQMSSGDVDIGLDYTLRALARDGVEAPGDAKAAYDTVKTRHMEQFNLVWLPPLGFSDPDTPGSIAAPVAQKHALKKFPALPRLIAKTHDTLTDETLARLAAKENAAKAAREFLREKKLI